MKQTFEIYRHHPSEWANMTYKNALAFRIDAAKSAMNFYRAKAEIYTSSDPDKYKCYVKKYKVSEKAVAFNRVLLEEVI